MPSPRNIKACHNIRDALIQSVAKIRTQSIMKSNRETLHEFSTHIPQKPSKGTKSRSTNEMMRADITIRSQRTRVRYTHAREVTEGHQYYQAVDLNQPP
jgi:hypothetical protein